MKHKNYKQPFFQNFSKKLKYSPVFSSHVVWKTKSIVFPTLSKKHVASVSLKILKRKKVFFYIEFQDEIRFLFLLETRCINNSNFVFASRYIEQFSMLTEYLRYCNRKNPDKTFPFKFWAA